jgi:hypothetical protein
MENPVIPARLLKADGGVVDQSSIHKIHENRDAILKLGLPPFVKDRVIKPGKIAIVGYGPSLKETWPRLREFDTICTVSKAYGFLVDRGLIPAYHVDIDPHIYKVEFMAKPQPQTKFLLSTHIRPEYIEKLKAVGITPQLFHCGIEPYIKLDKRYPTFKVRFDAGVQAAELMFESGYRTQEWFGIEYGTRGRQTHAGLHWGASHEKTRCQVDVDGRLFDSTALFFHGLLLAEDFLCKRQALLKCTIHGDGLLGNFLQARGRARFTLKR